VVLVGKKIRDKEGELRDKREEIRKKKIRKKVVGRIRIGELNRR